MLMCITVPQLVTRLKCWSFSIDLDDNLKQIKKPIEVLRNAMDVTRSSEAFKKILGLVLSLGNYMNGGTAKGQADGFNISVLTKLDSTKDRTNRVTLLQYIAELANKKGHDCMQPFVE